MSEDTKCGCGKETKSLRDEFAMAVLTGYSAQQDERTYNHAKQPNLTAEEWQVQLLKTDAEFCYAMADAMMEVRKR